MNTTTRKEDNPNSSESVEASLEDFISQANATFPASDGWDLHTGDVELVDDEEGLEDAPVSPIVVKPSTRKAETAAHLIKKADRSARNKKITEAMLDDPNAKTTIAPPPTRSSSRRNPFEVQVPLEESIEADGLDAEPAPLDPPPTGPRRRTERTEVVATTGRGVPWTANPMVWIAGVFAAFVAGAVLVFIMVRTMMPSQPVVVQAPAPVLVPTPAAQPNAAPVVTPLDKTAQADKGDKSPVVTPLEGAARAPTPDEIPPPPVEKRAHHAAAAAHHAKAAAPVREAKASAPAAKPEHHAAAKASDDDDDDDAAPAPKKASKKTAAKGEKKGGGDWVDPFAQ